MKKIPTFVVVAALAVGLAACSSGNDAAPAPNVPTSTPAPDTVPPLPAVPSPTVKPGPISLAVTLRSVEGVQAEVVTIDGWTVYRFEADENKPSKVNCDNDCLVTWPPLLTDGSEIKLSSIDPKLVGTVTRADGLTQVTLNGWPLYRFADDKARADTKGEGVGGNWSVIRPDGKPVITKN